MGRQSACHACEKANEVESKEHVDRHEEPAAGNARRQIPEEWHDEYESQEGGGHHPGQMLHSPFDRHLVSHWPQNVVAAEQAEKIEKGPTYRYDFMRACAGETLYGGTKLHRPAS